jgi:hypothetical protein
MRTHATRSPLSTSARERVAYRIVDEYDDVFELPAKTSLRPLSLLEVIFEFEAAAEAYSLGNLRWHLREGSTPGPFHDPSFLQIESAISNSHLMSASRSLLGLSIHS